MIRLTAHDILKHKKSRKKITMLSTYDFPFAKLADESGVDVVLVGDSVGMVCLGYESTLPVTMEDMIHHTKAVSRAVTRALVVGDMPFGSYQNSAKEALKNAERFIRAGAQAVKLEGGKKVVKQVELLQKHQIPVMGHLGMTPQSIQELGGYKVQGRLKKEADQILSDARLLEKAGVFSIVFECIPYELAKQISRRLSVPTIGIGAGPYTDGQVLVLHDLLGFKSQVSPRFVRRYADLDGVIRTAISKFNRDVETKKFPSLKESFK